jgi:ABC-2 type transport system ATP-binding protein
MAAGLTSSRAESAAAVAGPSASSNWATRSLVRSPAIFTTTVCPKYGPASTPGARRNARFLDSGPVGTAVDAAVEVSGLVKRYGDTPAVDGLSLHAAAGEVLALLGPNGAGKTTTVEICEGFRHADSGRVRILGRDPGDRALRARVGVMPQSGGAYPGARAGELLRLMASYYDGPRDPAALLERLGLSASARTPWRRMSGGQQQRLSLAMAVVGRPELVFLDEPTAGLDVQARHATWDLVRELRDDGVSVVLTTHAMEEAEILADQVVIVDHGRVVAAGSPHDLTRGGARGQLRFRAPAGLPIGELLTALQPGTTAEEPSRGSYLVEGEVDPQLLAAVTAWCASFNAMTEDLRVEQRSLEDVFLELTGRELRT